MCITIYREGAVGLGTAELGTDPGQQDVVLGVPSSAVPDALQFLEASDEAGFLDQCQGGGPLKCARLWGSNGFKTERRGLTSPKMLRAGVGLPGQIGQCDFQIPAENVPHLLRGSGLLQGLPGVD